MLHVPANNIPSIACHEILKANSLIQLDRFIGDRKGKSMSLLQSKAVNYAIGLLDQDAKELHPVEFTVEEFWAACGITNISGKHVRMLADALKAAADKSSYVLIRDPVTGKERTPLVRIIAKPEFRDKGKTCIINFDPDIAPALLQLRENFTKYPDTAIMRLDSIYGYRVFETIMSFDGLNHPALIFSLEDLAENFDAIGYTPSDFRVRVIEAGVKDINEHCPLLSVEYRMIKTGKPFTHVEFIARRKEPAIEEPKISEEAIVISSHQEREQRIMQQIGFEDIHLDIQADKVPYDVGALRLIVRVIDEVMTSTDETININRTPISAEVVKERFSQLQQLHVEYVLQCICDAGTEIANPKPYLKTALYNALDTAEFNASRKANKDKNRKSQKRRLDAEEQAAIDRILAEDSRKDPDIQAAIDRLLRDDPLEGEDL